MDCRLLADHPHTVDFYGWWISPPADTNYRIVKIFLKLETGDLNKFAKENQDEEGRIDEAKRLKILINTSAALAGIHRMNIVHRDVKPGNILYTIRVRHRERFIFR